MIKAIGYDVDGTMVDSEPLHNAAWHEVLALNGHDFSDLPAEFRATMAGRKPIAIAEYMVNTLQVAVDPLTFLAQKRAIFMSKLDAELEPLPGVVESIKRLGKDYKLGIGTSLDREYVDIVLKKLGTVDDFSVIVTGDEITKGKPDPETYLVLARKMNVQPVEMVVLEDATTGIQSAKASGALCIAIANPETNAQDTSEADITVLSANEITPELISGL